jgi:hypothetical protein
MAIPGRLLLKVANSDPSEDGTHFSSSRRTENQNGNRDHGRLFL